MRVGPMDRIFITIINMSLTGAFVIAAICLARLPLKKAPKVISYCLWSVAGFRLVFPVTFQSMISLLPFKSNPIPADIATQSMPQIDSGLTVLDETVNTALPEVAVALNGSGPANTGSLLSWTQVAAWVWLAGFLLLAGYGVVSYLLLRRQMRSACRIEDEVFESDDVHSPFMLGFIHPRIYLPIGLTESERDHVVAHERVHIKRHDNIYKFAAYLILALHWFNPLAWLAFVLMGRDMELSCDERVIKELGYRQKQGYSLSLLSMTARSLSINGSPLAFAEGGLMMRINNVLNLKKPSRLVVALAIAFAMVLGLGFAMDRVSDVADQDAPLAGLAEADASPAITVRAYDNKIDWVFSQERQVQGFTREDVSLDYSKYYQVYDLPERNDVFGRIMAENTVEGLYHIKETTPITISVNEGEPIAVVLHSYIVDRNGRIIPGLDGYNQVYDNSYADQYFYQSVSPGFPDRVYSAENGAEANTDGYLLRACYITVYWEDVIREYAFIVRSDEARIINLSDLNGNFPANESGQTYGAITPVDDADAVIVPGLIAVGSSPDNYAYYADMYGYRDNNSPKSREEAALRTTAQSMKPEEAFALSVELQTGSSIDTDAARSVINSIGGLKDSVRMYKYLTQDEKDALIGLLPAGYQTEEVARTALELAYECNGVSIPTFRSDGVTQTGWFLCGGR